MNGSAQATRASLLIALRDPTDGCAWGTFVEIYTPLIFGCCRRHGLQDADASDVTQEVLRTVARRISDFEYDTSRGLFRSWLHTVVRSKLAGFAERRRRNPADPAHAGLVEQAESRDLERGAPIEEQWDRAYRRRVFDWASDRVRSEIRPGTWQAFWATAVEDRPPAEVARELGMSLGMVYVARSRVLTRLRGLVDRLAADRDPVIGGPVP